MLYIPSTSAQRFTAFEEKDVALNRALGVKSSNLDAMSLEWNGSQQGRGACGPPDVVEV